MTTKVEPYETTRPNGIVSVTAEPSHFGVELKDPATGADIAHKFLIERWTEENGEIVNRIFDRPVTP